MPFTPIHFGPGLAMKAVAPRYFSFTVFVFSQVLIDLEVLFYMLNGAWPIHRYFHTYPGAILIALASYVVGRPVCGICLAIYRRSFRMTKAGLVEAVKLISPVAALSAGVAGSFSHVVLDSIMHSDVQPLWPFADGNLLINSITIDELHGYCVVAGIAGLLGMGIWWLVWREQR